MLFRSGYTLTDDLTRPDQWTIPPGTTIAAHEFLLVWADNETRQYTPGHGLHVNFKLNQGGEEVGLFAPDGTLVDSVAFGPQRTDISEGRFPDGQAAPYFALTTPTPGRANVVGGGLEPVLAGIIVTAEAIAITWQVVPGVTYRVQFKDDLNEAAWRDFGNAIVASEASLTISDPALTQNTQRFYRVVVVR